MTFENSAAGFYFKKRLPLWVIYRTDLLPYDDMIITVILCY